MTLIIDNPTVERVLRPSEVNAVLETAARELAMGSAINAPPYRVFTPRDPADYMACPRFPDRGSEATHHAFTSLTGAIAALEVTSDRIDSDIITYFRQGDSLLQRRVPAHPEGKFCGLVYLYSSRTGEPLAIIHDGFLQKFRVAENVATVTERMANTLAGMKLPTTFLRIANAPCQSSVFIIVRQAERQAKLRPGQRSLIPPSTWQP
jgi:alanine dehydrogenase